MQIADCFFIGYTKSANKKGEIQIAPETQNPEQFYYIKQLFLQLSKSDNEVVPFFVKNIRFISNKNISVQLEDINSIEEAEALCGKSVFLPLSELPKLEGNKFYFFEVEGFNVVDKQYGLVGILDHIEDYATNAVFVVKVNEKEVLIPVVSDFVEKVDRKNKEIHIVAPEGLIELYVNGL